MLLLSMLIHESPAAPKRKLAARAKKTVVVIDSDSESDFSEDEAPAAPKRKLAARAKLP